MRGGCTAACLAACPLECKRQGRTSMRATLLYSCHWQYGDQLQRQLECCQLLNAITTLFTANSRVCQVGNTGGTVNHTQEHRSKYRQKCMHGHLQQRSKQNDSMQRLVAQVTVRLSARRPKSRQGLDHTPLLSNPVFDKRIARQGDQNVYRHNRQLA
jgi:hypothetical protein